MIILAIETSCDETSMAILQDKKVLANVVSSQIMSHKEYGGVVPELASRLHLKNLSYVLNTALHNAKILAKDIDYVAYTETPGLIGALHIGKIAAQTIGLYLQKPVLPVNHLHGHIYAGAINYSFAFPLLALLVSGGHTQLVLMRQHLQFELLGSTLDDAVGECYDKVARMLGFDYPGGVEIDKAAQQGELGHYQLSMPLDDNSYNFSFSGLKSACANMLKNFHTNNIEVNINDFCRTLQETVVELLMKKTCQALQEYHPKMLVLAGGVSANSLLREKFLNLATEKLTVVVPELEYCTDNAAMIARVAYEKITVGDSPNLV